MVYKRIFVMAGIGEENTETGENVRNEPFKLVLLYDKEKKDLKYIEQTINKMFTEIKKNIMDEVLKND